MLTSRSLSKGLQRSQYVCADCRKRLTETLRPRQQQRGISQNALRKMQSSEEEWNMRAKQIRDGSAKSMLGILEERGLLNQIVGNRDALDKVLTERRVGVYCGVDPTAPSLHIGHIVPLMALSWMYIHGYSATFLIGGFTSSIGDPTDRLDARPQQARTQRRTNVVSMTEQMKRFTAFMEEYAAKCGYQREWAWRRAVLNNSNWHAKLTIIDYMKYLGKGMRMGPMLGRDSVKNRLEKGSGMSYAEFSYPLIQGWDWWHQFKTGTQIQIGGADQYGNIMSGAEVVKTALAEDVDFSKHYAENLKGSRATGDPLGFTVPLLTTSSGEKFGKSAGNAIWIDPQMTSSYELYQFFLRSADEDVERYLKMLTFISIPEIQSVMSEHRKDESQRIAQHRLAFEFVQLVHGVRGATRAKEKHAEAFGTALTIDRIKAQAESPPESEQTNFKPVTTSDGRPLDFHPSLNKNTTHLTRESSSDLNIKLPQSLVVHQPLPRILMSAGLVASRSEGQRLINNGGIYIGGRIGRDGKPAPMQDTVSYIPATDPKWGFIEPLIVDNILVLRTGKWKKKFIHIVSDEEYEASGEDCPGWKEMKQVRAAIEAEKLAVLEGRANDEETKGEGDVDVDKNVDPLTKADLAGEEALRISMHKNKLVQEQKRRDRKSLKVGPYSTVQGARFRTDSFEK